MRMTARTLPPRFARVPFKPMKFDGQLLVRLRPQFGRRAGVAWQLLCC
jgi:hypothetical protein